MSGLLYPDTYVKPGTYIGKSTKDKIPSIPNLQFPVVIGRGSKYVESSETLIRGFVYQELVSVSKLYPNTFKTKFPLVKDVSKITIYKNDSIISRKLWSIVDENTIELFEYEPDASYTIDYQSSSNDVKDKISLDIVKFNSVGNTSGGYNYEEFKNFYLEYYFDNFRLNGNPDDSTLTVYPEYLNDKDYPVLSESECPEYLDVIIGDVKNNIRIEGIVSRVDKTINPDESESIKFIWLEFYYEMSGFKPKKTYFKVPNDSKYHYWNGIGFKVTSENIVGKELTEDGHFIEEHTNPDTFSITALAPKKMIEGPSRTISARVVSKGELSKNGIIYNIFSNCPPNSYSINTDNANSRDCHIVLNTDDYFYKEGILYLVLVLSDDLGNADYEEVPCEIEHGKIYLIEEIAQLSISGIEVELYKNAVIALLTEDEEAIQTEDDLILLVESDESEIIPLKRLLLSFDYARAASDHPTVVEVSNTNSSSLETITIDYDDYYSFNNILVKFNDVPDAGSIISFDVIRTGYICWNLTEIVEENNPPILTDVTGELTGEYCTKYIQLKGEYLSDLVVESDEPFDYEVVTKNGKSYLVITLNGMPYEPRGNIKLTYRTYTAQPDNGNKYYVNALCIRPDSMYNTLIEVTSADEGRALLGPFTPLNDLYIANEIAWREFNVPNTYGYVQIKDSDGDDVISEEDIVASLDALVHNKRATDIVILRNERFKGQLIDFNDRENDPFESNENKIWFHSDDIEYVNLLKLGQYAEFKNAVANKNATIQFNVFGSTASLRVDGTFIAWALACVRNSIGYSESILNRKIKSFNSIEVYSEVENNKFGANNIMYITTNSSGDYIIMEDCSVQSLEQISNQKILTTKYVRMRLDEEVGKVIDSPSEILNTIQSRLVTILNEAISQNYISNYLDEEGNKRPIDPKLDIFVKQVTATQFQFGYGFYTKKGIRHLFGNYVVDAAIN